MDVYSFSVTLECELSIDIHVFLLALYTILVDIMHFKSYLHFLYFAKFQFKFNAIFLRVMYQYCINFYLCK